MRAYRFLRAPDLGAKAQLNPPGPCASPIRVHQLIVMSIMRCLTSPMYQVIEMCITIRTLAFTSSGSNNLDDHTGEQETKRRVSNRRFHDGKEKIRGSRLFIEARQQFKRNGACGSSPNGSEIASVLISSVIFIFLLKRLIHQGVSLQMYE